MTRSVKIFCHLPPSTGDTKTTPQKYDTWICWVLGTEGHQKTLRVSGPRSLWSLWEARVPLLQSRSQKLWTFPKARNKNQRHHSNVPSSLSIHGSWQNSMFWLYVPWMNLYLFKSHSINLAHLRHWSNSYQVYPLYSLCKWQRRGRVSWGQKLFKEQKPVGVAGLKGEHNLTEAKGERK